LPKTGNLGVEKVGGPGKKHWVFGRSFESNPRPRSRDNTVYEDADWRVQISPAAEATEDLFLNAMLVTNRESEHLPAVAAIDQADRVGVLVANRAVLFDRTAERTDRPIIFTLTGPGTWCIFVADLAQGIWQVRRNGEIHLAGLPVTGDSGVLFFEGPAGDYKLLR
jgi:hypothetical protein